MGETFSPFPQQPHKSPPLRRNIRQSDTSTPSSLFPWEREDLRSTPKGRPASSVSSSDVILKNSDSGMEEALRNEIDGKPLHSLLGFQFCTEKLNLNHKMKQGIFLQPAQTMLFISLILNYRLSYISLPGLLEFRTFACLRCNNHKWMQSKVTIYNVCAWQPMRSTSSVAWADLCSICMFREIGDFYSSRSFRLCWK